MSRFDHFKFVYSPGISTTNDLRAECQRLLKVAKQIMEEGKQLVPTGFVVKPDGSLDLYTRDTEPGSWQKTASHNLLSAQAKQCNAVAVILLTDVWVKWTQGSDEEREAYLRNYRQGDIAVDPDRKECLNLTAIGPSIDYQVACFYHRAGGGKIIVWEKTWDSTENPGLQMEQGLITPWWDTSKTTVVS